MIRVLLVLLVLPLFLVACNSGLLPTTDTPVTVNSDRGALGTGPWTEYYGSARIDHPWNLPLSDRWSVWGYKQQRFWVFSNDQPFQQGSPTKPRTEAKLIGPIVNGVADDHGREYNSGVHQFEADVIIPSPANAPTAPAGAPGGAGNDGFSIVQVFAANDGSSTTTQLRILNGKLCYITTVIPNFTLQYDVPFHVNLVHDADANAGMGRVDVYINGATTPNYTTVGRGNNPSQPHYFKFGVYTQNGATASMCAQFHAVRMYSRNANAW